MNNKGFTLIELIITIALLAVISIISFVSINGVIEKNRIENCENLRKSIISAAKEYVSDNRYDSLFVDGVSGMKVNITAQILINNNNLSGKIVNPFNNEEINNAENVKITIELNNDYTAKEVIIKNNSGNEYNCDVESWWNGL